MVLEGRCHVNQRVLELVEIMMGQATGENRPEPYVKDMGVRALGGPLKVGCRSDR